MKAGSVLRPQGFTTKLSARHVAAVSESLLSECCFVLNAVLSSLWDFQCFSYGCLSPISFREPSRLTESTEVLSY